MRLIDIKNGSKIAYFSMEVGLEEYIPTYSGGLGILAGDTLRSAADIRVPLVGVTLLHKKGYFNQKLDSAGVQSEEPVYWRPADYLEPLNTRVSVRIEGREVVVGIWRYNVEGVSGHNVPLYYLDTDQKENTPFDRTLTDHLYGGDNHYRICQEVILGLGGIAALNALGYSNNINYHMNEGHAAFLTMALLDLQTGRRPISEFSDTDIEKVRKRCIFTTHTPVPAGHDNFTIDLVNKVLGHELTDTIEKLLSLGGTSLNMTYLALFFSRYINGVAMRHGEVSRSMFPTYPINAITNGVHATTWTSPHMAALFDERIWGWRNDNFYLRYAFDIPRAEIKKAHMADKINMIAEIREMTGDELDPDVLTLGVARRATPYKRLDLIFSDIDRLVDISISVGPLQIVYSGKAHPNDKPGKEIIKKIFSARKDLESKIKVVYIENYDIEIAKTIVAGVDIWVNTPLRPREASGTSGMKAALNGVPSFSVHDGWWVEGHIEGVTGWLIGGEEKTPPDTEELIDDMYDKLERVIVPTYYGDPMKFASVMRSAIALNGSFFNTQRMVSQYLCNAYFPVINGAD